MSGFEGEEVMHSGTADSKLLHVGRHTVGVPAGPRAIVVPAVDGVAGTVAIWLVLTSVQSPIAPTGPKVIVALSRL